MHTSSLPPAAHAVRADVLCSVTVSPRRVMVLDKSGNPLGLGHISAEHRQGGHLTGYRVRLDEGTCLTIWPVQARCPDNVVVPSPCAWRQLQGNA